MRLLDLIPLACLTAYLALSLGAESTPRNAALWLTALAALVFGLYALDHGRWQAWGVVAAAVLALAPLIRAALIERAVPAEPRSFANVVNRLAIALLVAGTAWLCWSLPAQDLPRPTGSFKIGTTSFDLVDSARVDPFAPRPEPRRIQVRAWYPADPPAEAPPYPYLVGDEARLRREFRQADRAAGVLLGSTPTGPYQQRSRRADPCWYRAAAGRGVQPRLLVVQHPEHGVDGNAGESRLPGLEVHRHDVAYVRTWAVNNQSIQSRR